MPSAPLVCVVITLSPPFTVMAPTAFIALADEELAYFAPVVLTLRMGPSPPSLPMMMVPSLLIPLPPGDADGTAYRGEHIVTTDTFGRCASIGNGNRSSAKGDVLIALDAYGRHKATT